MAVLNANPGHARSPSICVIADQGAVDVRSGTSADITARSRHVRFTPNNGSWAAHSSQHSAVGLRVHALVLKQLRFLLSWSLFRRSSSSPPFRQCHGGHASGLWWIVGWGPRLDAMRCSASMGRVDRPRSWAGHVGRGCINGAPEFLVGVVRTLNSGEGHVSRPCQRLEQADSCLVEIGPVPGWLARC